MSEEKWENPLLLKYQLVDTAWILCTEVCVYVCVGGGTGVGVRVEGGGTLISM